MGRGIVAIIPTLFIMKDRDAKYLSQDYLKRFVCLEKREEYEHPSLYQIDKQLLLKQFKPFFQEFREVLYTKEEQEENPSWIEGCWDQYNEIVEKNDFEEFMLFFDGRERNNQMPCRAWWNHSTLGMDRIQDCINISIGSYGAYLEEYTTLLQMERLIAKAIPNELAKTVKLTMAG